jgi:hypothetical protein
MRRLHQYAGIKTRAQRPERAQRHESAPTEPWAAVARLRHHEDRDDHQRTVACTSHACGGGFGPGGLWHRAGVRDSHRRAYVAERSRWYTSHRRSVGETFTPAVNDEGPGLLSPARAYGRDIPTGTSHQLGYLTLPLGAGAPGQYTAHNALVYAFTYPKCGPQFPPAPMIGASSAPTPSAAPTDCTQWEFVDARTGDMIDETWTQ